MTETGGTRRLIIERGTRPVLPRHLRLRHDAGRGRWLLLAPERILTPDDIAVSILRLCDGARTVDEIVETLAADYDAAVEDIRGDVIGLLQDMADKRYIES
jgi:pyrroloquinoline quinone biosynthesis protein D